MDEQAHIDRIRANGWSQGHILSPAVAEAARTCGDQRWPQHLNIDTARDWLVIVSHPCDVRNRRPGKEPTAEVLLARPYSNQKDKLHSTFTHGKNSRRYDFEGGCEASPIKLTAAAYERFPINRMVLADAPPDPQRTLDGETIKVLREWIAKRYIRQAFPDAFDQAADAVKAKDKVDDYLIRHRRTLTVVEVFVAFPAQTQPPFDLDFLIVVNPDQVGADWPALQGRLEDEFEACWNGATGITIEVTAKSADLVTLAELARGRYMKFDREWISYEHDPESGPAPGG